MRLPMRIPFKGWKWQELVELFIVFGISNFIGITLFAGMVYCILNYSVPWGKRS